MTANLSNIKFSYWFLNKTNARHSNISLEEKKLREGFDKLLILIKDALSSNQEFSVSAYKLFNEIFQLRIDSIKFLAKQDIDTENIYDKILDDLEDEEENELFENLIENIAFGTRTLKRVGKRLNQALSFDSKMKPQDDIESIPNFSYDEFVKILKPNLPNEISKEFFNFLGSSLMLETSIIAADFLMENYLELNISKSKIIELEKLIVDNAQLYGASAIGLGFIKERKVKFDIDPTNIDWIDEQKKIAELGIDEYKKGLD